MLDPVDRAVVNLLQEGIAVCERPFTDVGVKLGLEVEDVIARARAMLDSGALTRFGPMFGAERLGGVFTLCAIRVPRNRFKEVALIGNGFDEVAHDHEREHLPNMWFVIGADSPARITESVDAIEQVTDLNVVSLPKLEEFYVGLKLEA